MSKLTKIDDKTLEIETTIIETKSLFTLQSEMADIDKSLWRNSNQKEVLSTQKTEKQKELDKLKGT